MSLRVRRPGGRKRVQLLVAYGVRADCTRQLLAFTRSTGESQTAWEGLLHDLYRRGPRCIEAGPAGVGDPMCQRLEPRGPTLLVRRASPRTLTARRQINGRLPKRHECLCRHLAAHALGIEGTRQLVHLDEVPLQAFLVVRAGIEDLPVAVRAPDLLRLLQGRRAAKQQAHGDQRDALLVTYAHVPPPDSEDHRRLLLVMLGRHRGRRPYLDQSAGERTVGFERKEIQNVTSNLPLARRGRSWTASDAGNDKTDFRTACSAMERIV